jgi:hypothetical protein
VGRIEERSDIGNGPTQPLRRPMQSSSYSIILERFRAFFGPMMVYLCRISRRTMYTSLVHICKIHIHVGIFIVLSLFILMHVTRI